VLPNMMAPIIIIISIKIGEVIISDFLTRHRLRAIVRPSPTGSILRPMRSSW
jgi:hypothetical protein